MVLHCAMNFFVAKNSHRTVLVLEGRQHSCCCCK